MNESTFEPKRNEDNCVSSINTTDQQKVYINVFFLLIKTIRCKMRRLSKREKLQEQVKSFDVFNKVEPDTGITQQTTSGAIGRVSICDVAHYSILT